MSAQTDHGGADAIRSTEAECPSSAEGVLLG